MLSEQPACVLIVDDAAENLTLLNGLLKDKYRVRAANNGALALEIARKVPIDIVLLDVVMPGMTGYDVCRELKSDPELKHIPVVFLTARDSVEDEHHGFDLGASDYISKPISPPIVMARIKNLLQVKASQDFLRDQNQFLEQEVQRRTRQISEIQDVTISALASLAETRDQETGFHIRRTQWYVKLLAQKIREQDKFAKLMTDEYIETLFKSAPLHDIGKVGIPDHILLKPGKLDNDEFTVMKTHADLGWHAIEEAEKTIGSKESFLEVAKEIAHFHHEKWDGSGYPEGLAGEDIPLSARLMAIADVYDALISKRVYKSAMTHEAALQIIRNGSGNHFDPVLVDAFFAIEADFFAIANKFRDD
ncbi:response regulator [Shewanella khirikhana]|uniref:Cyclic di-GMP phosphodiesterase response regulator RpfG n=1 Tax=Shewanella khirikhana TaxID=1965282 RepID=A0ABM7DS44_9GAMM|nr:two-component system response regulator [Shewanella khirikhana]AZQ12526.1 Cyclic di-GMP phosphodiesterase response regulator RpfG [Shewanella khirikhana]